MERNRNRQTAAFTRLELSVVLVILALLAYLFSFTCYYSPKSGIAARITCVNNLKQIGVAYHVWSNDHTNNPFGASISQGGWKDFLANENAGKWYWTNYVIMQNELGQTPRLLICPSDDRNPATNFANLRNTNISYFLSIADNDAFPQSFLGGDRNLNRGLSPSADYGFSPANGQGNDIAVQTNSLADPLSWTLKIHSEGKASGAGNLLLGDGSVQQVNGTRLRADFQPHQPVTTNWPSNHLPTAPSFRLIFP